MRVVLLKAHMVGLVLVALTACSSAAQPAPAAAAPGGGPAPADVVATIGSTSITLAELDQEALNESAAAFGSIPLRHALYEARRAALDEMVARRLLEQDAAARGTTLQAVVAGLSAKADESPITDADVTAWYDSHQDRVQGAPLDAVRAPIRAVIAGERFDAAREAYLETLRAKTPVTIRLEAPRVEMAEAGRPARGPENAPIRLIEFSDFQCPFCLRAFPTVMKVLDTYGDRIRFVYRHYPLQNHPEARPAAEAAQCAHAQGKFWPFHNRLFENPGHLSAADLKQAAADLGLDTAAFDACVAGRTYRDDVDADIAAADAAGISGTPAFFINGRILSGAQPFEAFKKVIDEELASKR
ncbi:MAG: thioredoxin domain-containing protein [Acidobacteria bacterium]|nr:thioredoxin domain-containing protein [Acidobacteriota bacterium]